MADGDAARGADARIRAALERECLAYTRYLTGREPDAYIIGKYVECHQLGRIPAAANRFERFLISVSVRGVFLTRMADAYASRLLKYGTLRKKLVLTLALLECSRDSFEALDRVDPGGFAGTVARAAYRVLVFALALTLGLALFVPARLVARGR